jgi:hypothetical protein
MPKTSKTKSVTLMLSSHHKKDIARNKHIAKDTIKVLTLCSRQNIAILEHNKDKTNSMEILRVIEWAIVVNLQFSNFSAISWREQVNFPWDDDDVRFVLDQHAELDFNSASSLIQQSAGRHVAPLGHIILIPSQPIFALSP